MRSYKLWLSGQWTTGSETRDVRSPFDAKVVANAEQASRTQVEEAITAATSAFQTFKHSSRYIRSRLLSVIVREIEKNKSEFIERLIQECGKPRGLATVEFQRCVSTFSIAIEELKRFGGEVVPIDIDAGGRAYDSAISMWVPRGPVLAITPFNFPLNLVAHKVAPALAVGTTVLLKPPPQAPGCSVLLAEIFEKAAAEVSDNHEKIPLAAFQVLSASNDAIEPAITDARLTTLSFTGSDRVGWMLQGKAIRKKVLLELGGNAGVIIHSDADLKRAANRCAAGGFGYAGQTCISVQRIFVQKKVMSEFIELLIGETSKLKCGDPSENDISVGPLIDKGAADRIEEWLGEAKMKGAQVLLGGQRRGNIITPAVLTRVPREARLNCEEVFGPVVLLYEYDHFEDALNEMNNSRFGLQAGVFTESERRIRQSFETLEVGGVIINEIPTFRADNMPYGGVKDSGLGREGLRYAMEDYCERRVLVQWKGLPS